MAAPTRSKYVMLLGFKEHPETYGERGETPPAGARESDRELLYPADVFETYDLLINPPGDGPGGWKEAIEWDYIDGAAAMETMGQRTPGRVIKGVKRYGLRCCQKLADQSVEESRTMRAEPSKVVGINITEADYEKGKSLEESQEAAVYPELPAAANAPASVRRRK